MGGRLGSLSWFYLSNDYMRLNLLLAFLYKGLRQQVHVYIITDMLAALLAQPSYANKILLHLSMACIGWSWLTAQHPYAP